MTVLTVEDVFDVPGRGVVVTGTLVGGSLRSGTPVVLQRANGRDRHCVCIGIEQFRRLLEEANEGELVGLLLADLTASDVDPDDQVVALE
ncbi:MAG TPA: EF-Tu/IF-2/RF-3 family GTPase [Acidimicrobiales bacterium]|nr:EF-Tu/IF-2/RF-3 family GTPase [Acidimicrobiales bacterium]